MAKIGRNDACPCGSGKKHEKCCLEAAGPSPLGPVKPNAATTPACQSCGRQAGDEHDDDGIDEINERADHILDELLAGRVDAAETLCHDLLRDFPDDAEGLDLLSMVYEERGQRERALELLRQASTIAHARPDYDAETRTLMNRRIKELEVRA